MQNKSRKRKKGKANTTKYSFEGLFGSVKGGPKSSWKEIDAIVYDS